jgi:glutathione S-transferase
MITLYGCGPGFGLPEISPHVTKTEVQLKMAGLPYRKAPAPPELSPKGQLPFIDDDGELIADSTFIRAHIEARYGVDLDAGLDGTGRAEAWIIERAIENHLGWCMVHARWLLKPNFDKGPGQVFDGAPDAMRRDVYRQVNANVRAVGIGRHSDDEIADLGETSVSALARLLQDRRFILGDQPVSVDAVMFAMLAAILTPFFDSPLRRRTERYPTLVAYVDRMMRRYYPDHPWAAVARMEAA